MTSLKSDKVAHTIFRRNFTLQSSLTCGGYGTVVEPFCFQRGGRSAADPHSRCLLHHHRDDRHHWGRQLCPPLL